MDELNACTECGFTTTVFSEFQGHIEKHEMEHSRSSSGDMTNSQSIEWADGSQSSTPSPRSTPPTDPTPSPNSSEANPITEITNTLLNIKKETGGKGQKTVHVCPHCNFTTCMSQHMKSHLEAHERHQGQMYQCDICKMQFSQKANMHRHRMRHSGVKPYECRFCKKRFFRKDQMQEHSMTHIKTGYGFDCPVSQCTMQFSQHNSLRAHLEETHTISSSNPASCKRCNLMFANSRRLLLHYQTRHDDSEAAPTSPTKRESTPKRKKLANGTAMAVPEPTNLSISEQLHRMIKNNSPPNTETSESSTTLTDFEQPNLQISNQDLLMMCLSNVTQSPFAAFENLPRTLLNMVGMPIPQIPAQTPVVKESVQLWSEQTSSSVSVSAPSPSEQSHTPPANEAVSATTTADAEVAESTEKLSVEEKEEQENVECNHCGMIFFDNTMFLLHKSLHTEGDPFKCALCGTQCGEKYMFTTHMIFADHSSQTPAFS